jgi:hypothetical protein
MIDSIETNKDSYKPKPNAASRSPLKPKAAIGGRRMQNIEQDKGKAIDRRQGEEGFSIIGILISAGVALTGILYYNQGLLNVRFAGKSLESATSYESFVESFTSFVSTSVITNINKICAADPAAMSNLTFLGTNVTSTGSEIYQTQFNAITASRCLNPDYKPNGQLHFCLKFDRNSAYSKDSFAGAEYNYAEISVKMVNKWQQVITCNDFKAGTKETAGMQIFYRLYWMTKTQPGRFFQKQGYYYAAKS